jgi:cytochrome c553
VFMKTLITIVSIAFVLGAASLLTAAAPPSDDLGFEEATSSQIVAVDIKKGLKKCRLCHGKTLAGKKKAPAIAGDSRKEIMQALTTKVVKQMKAVVKGLDAAQKAAIADLINKIPKTPKKAPTTK